MKKIFTIIICLVLVLNLLPIHAVTADSVCTDNLCTEHHHSTVLTTDQTTLSDVFLGDLDSSNSFTVSDLILLAKQLISVTKDDTTDVKATDINGDYKTSVIDLVRFKKHLAYADSSAFTYTIENNQAIITGCNSTQNEYLTIPFEIDNIPVTEIAAGAFENCSNIAAILIPSSVKDIGDNAFSNCTSLKSIALPDSVYTLGKNAFLKCDSISSIRLSDNITVICENTFNSCSSLKDIILPENIEEIGESAFYLCSSLIELNIPEKVTVLNDDTFYGCTNLIFIGLPENLKEIKCYTFYSCENLQSISIPITVVNVGDNAFDSCISLLSVVVPYETAFGTNVFTNCPVLVVEGFAGAGGIDAAINSGANYKLMECGHSEFLLLNAVNPSCQKEGYSGDQYCTKCGKIENPGFVVSKTAHIPKVINAKEVTCTEDGYTGTTICSVCDTIIKTGYIIECKGHYAEEMPGYIAATCTTNGVYGVFTCEVCKKELNNDIIPATNHEDWAIIGKVYADCVNDGYSGDYYCYDCHSTFKTGSVIPSGEHYYISNNKKYATCQQDGYTGDFYCKGCGALSSTGTVIPKENHNLYTENYKAATCTENGFSGDSTCTKCNQVISKGQVLPLLGHKSILINYREPTCTEDGYTGDQICSVCKVYVSSGKLIEKTDHKVVLKGYKEATQTHAGYTGDYVCEICNAIIQKGNIIPANHEHSFEIKNTKEPTCSQQGYTGDSVCQECGYVVAGEAIQTIAHNCEATTFTETCTTQGYVLHSCKNCEYSYKTDIVPALNHDWDSDWTIDSNASCTQNGSKHKNCSRCDELLTETIKALGHTLGEVKNQVDPSCTESGYSGDRNCKNCDYIEYGIAIDPTGHCYTSVVTAPTCVAKGFTVYTCQKCQHSYTDSFTDAKGHTLGEPTNVIKPTCTENGYSGDRSCSDCDYIEYGQTINASGHVYSHIVTDPTCKEQGYTTHSCKNCTYTYKDNYTAIIDHNYVDGVCTVCGEKDLSIPSYTIIQSRHPYSADSCEEYIVEFKGASSINISFGPNTCTESSFDYINIFDASGQLVGKYTGEELSSKTINVPSEEVRITISSDSSVQYYGFLAVAYPDYAACSQCGNIISYTIANEGNCMTEGVISSVCENCGDSTITFENYKHYFNASGTCEYCNSNCFHENTSFEEGNYEGYYHCYDCGANICYSCNMPENECYCTTMGDYCPYCGMPMWECMCGGGEYCPMCGMPLWECMCGGTEIPPGIEE